MTFNLHRLGLNELFGGVEDLPGIGKIQAVLLDILFVLFFVPLEFHRGSLLVG